MSNAYNKAVNNRGLLDRLIGKLPGYQGYIDRDARQESDRIQREFISKQLFDMKKPVQEIINEVMSTGDLMALPKFEKITNRIDKVAQRIRSASYGSAQFFGASGIGEAELQRLHEFDMGLVDCVEEVKGEIKELEQSVGESSKMNDKIKSVLAVLERVDEHFQKREEIIKKG